MRKIYLLLSHFFVFLLGIFLILFFSSNEKEILGEIREGSSSLTNPLLECDIVNFKELPIFKSKIEKLTKQLLEQEMITGVSVYFRQLNNGVWFGVNEHDLYYPASLLKVPLMMTYFKMEEARPGFLEKKIELVKLNENFSTSTVLKPGSYKIIDLIKHMIQDSDNQATELLYHNIDFKDFKVIYQDLGFEIPDINKSILNYSISIKRYASFFRILFNASYLSEDFSERALEILLGSKFREGLAASLPSDIKVAHKFGMRILDDKIQLHDCGIVYFPGEPYLLCVMTRGNNNIYLTQAIQKISKAVFDEVKYQRN